MQIRKFKDSDTEELAQMHNETIRTINVKDYPKKQIEVWAGPKLAIRKYPKDRIRFIALDKNKIVGFGAFKDDDITAVYVHKDYVGKGVGKELLKKLEYTAYKKGVRKIKCVSTITAKDFYEKHGYKIIKKTKLKIKDQKLVVYEMEKILRQYH